MRRRRHSWPPAPAWPTECKHYGSVRDRRSRRLLSWWAGCGDDAAGRRYRAAVVGNRPDLRPAEEHTVVATIPSALGRMILWQ